MRPDWDTYFARIADVVATRGNCLRKQVGCVIVVDQRIVSAGYNGPPSGVKSCVDGPGFCPCAADPGSQRQGTATISRDLCPSLHAEQNAVAYAGRECKGGTAYITTHPCRPCHRLLQSAGVVRIVVDGTEWQHG